MGLQEKPRRMEGQIATWLRDPSPCHVPGKLAWVWPAMHSWASCGLQRLLITTPADVVAGLRGRQRVPPDWTTDGWTMEEQGGDGGASLSLSGVPCSGYLLGFRFFKEQGKQDTRKNQMESAQKYQRAAESAQKYQRVACHVSSCCSGPKQTAWCLLEMSSTNRAASRSPTSCY